MNNAVYYYLIDSIVNTYLEEHCGCSPKSTSSRDAAPPLAIGLVISSQCTFFSPLSFPRSSSLVCAVSALGRSSVTYEVGFFPDDDESSGASAVEDTHTSSWTRETRKTVREGMSSELKSGLQAIHNYLKEDELEEATTTNYQV